MALDLASLASKQATATVHYLGESAQITYNPALLTQENYSKSQSGDRAFTEFFCRLVSEWDVTSGGEPVPVSVESCDSMPLQFLRKVFETIMRDGGADPDEGKASSST